MPVIEEAFETLRRSGLGPDARGALCAILDQVMDDFDRDGIQWAERLKYRALMDSLDAGEPIRRKASLHEPARVLEAAGAEGVPSLAAEISPEDERVPAAAPVQAGPAKDTAPANMAALAPWLKTLARLCTFFRQVQVQKMPSLAMNSSASSRGRTTPPMSSTSSHLRRCDQ